MNTNQSIEDAVDEMLSKQRMVNKIGQQPFDEFLAAINRIIAAERKGEIEGMMQRSDLAGIPIFNGNGMRLAKDRLAELDHLTKEGTQ